MITADQIKASLLAEIEQTAKTDALIREAIANGDLSGERIARECGLAATAVRNRQRRETPPIPKGLRRTPKPANHGGNIPAEPKPEPPAPAPAPAPAPKPEPTPAPAPKERPKVNAVPTLAVTLAKLKRCEDAAWAGRWIEALADAGPKLDSATVEAIRKGDDPQ